MGDAIGLGVNSIGSSLTGQLIIIRLIKIKNKSLFSLLLSSTLYQIN